MEKVAIVCFVLHCTSWGSILMPLTKQTLQDVCGRKNLTNEWIEKVNGKDGRIGRGTGILMYIFTVSHSCGSLWPWQWGHRQGYVRESKGMKETQIWNRWNRMEGRKRNSAEKPVGGLKGSRKKGERSGSKERGRAQGRWGRGGGRGTGGSTARWQVESQGQEES